MYCFQLECCGSKGPADWEKSVYNNYYDNMAPEIGIPKSKGGGSRFGSGLFNLPQSCCKDPDSQQCRDNIRSVSTDSIDDNVVNTEVRSKLQRVH